MTDNEIIGVLIDYGTQCKQEVISEAIDLINRQKAENDSLKVDLAKCSIRLDNLYKTADEIKSEAVKEFAKRLKCGVPQETGVIRCSDVDNLVKEMVGE